MQPVLVIFAVLHVFGVTTFASRNVSEVYVAYAQMFWSKNYGHKSLGVLQLRQMHEQIASSRDDFIYATITGRLRQIFPSGKHGLHIYENMPSDEDGCSDMGSHYNPLMKDHGGPKDKNRHVGDLGNVVADENGVVYVNIKDSIIQVGTSDIRFNVVGRGIAIHVGEDDLGIGGTNVSQTTGNAGDIVACGRIMLKEKEIDVKSLANDFFHELHLLVTLTIASVLIMKR